jgi:hypothetical protein
MILNSLLRHFAPEAYLLQGHFFDWSFFFLHPPLSADLCHQCDRVCKHEPAQLNISAPLLRLFDLHQYALSELVIN